MQHKVLLIAALIVVIGLLVATPTIIGTTYSSDDHTGRKATGPLWQNADNSDSRAAQARRTPQAEKQAPQQRSEELQRVPDAAKKQNAEIEALAKLYAQKGMTPEMARKIRELQAAQAGRAKTVPLSPELVKRLAKVRAAVQAKEGKSPIKVSARFPERSTMDPRFVKVAGKVTSSAKLALTPDAVLSVRVIDITQLDRPRVISEQMLANPGGMPVSFEVWYNKQSVNPRHRYAVQAVVADKGAIRWKTTAECKSVAEGKPANLAIPLRAVKAPEPTAPGMLVGDVHVEFDGDLVPIMTESGWMIPVEPVLKAAGIDLEYSESDKELTVQADGRIIKAKLPGRTVILTDGSKKDLAGDIEMRDGKAYAPIQFLQIATGRKALFDRESNNYVLVKM